MTRVRRIEDLLQRNRERNLTATSPRPRLSSLDARSLRATRLARERNTPLVRAARLAFVVSAAILLVAVSTRGVERVVVEGLVLSSPETLEVRCSSLLGQFWWNADLVPLRTELRAEPWIEDVAVDRGWPGEVRVRVRESRPVARAMVDDQLYAIDAHGRVHVVVEGLDLSALPMVLGAEVRHASLDAQSRTSFVELQTALSSNPWPWSGALEEIEFASDGVAVLRTADGVSLSLRPSRAQSSLHALAAAWSQLRPAAGDRIDLSFAHQIVVARAAHARSSSGPSSDQEG